MSQLRWHWRALALAFCLVALVGATAHATEPESAPVRIVLEHTPTGVGVVLTKRMAKRFSLAPGPVRIYTLGEWKELVAADKTITVLREQRALLKEENRYLEALIENKTATVALFHADLKSERALSDRYFGKWKECDKALLLCKAGSPWPWLVLAGGAVLAIAGGTALVVTLAKK